MQKEFIKNIYKEFVYCDPNDHLLNPNNTLRHPDRCLRNFSSVTRPETTTKHMLNKVSPLNNPQFVTINSETASQKPKLEVRITGDNTTSKKSEGLKTRNNSEIILVTPKIDLEDVEIQIPPLSNDGEKKDMTEKIKKKIIPKEPIIYSEEVFNQIELRGFITKDLLRMSLDKGSNLFHIAEEIFEKLVDRYNQFKEILHTLETEFDNTVECIMEAKPPQASERSRIETGTVTNCLRCQRHRKELGKKINHIIYQLYLAIMNRRL